MNRSILRKIICTVVILILAAIPAACGNQSGELKYRVAGMYGENREITGNGDRQLAVRCGNGTYEGLADGTVVSYKGIPFAEPPTGKLRWKPPVPAGDRGGVYEAYYFGRSPIQTEWPSEPGSYYPQGEDCLTLNVWTNSSCDLTDKAVMVFFHGGSYAWGAVSDPMYDGHNLVEKFPDIVLVTAEYRTGIMGFIDFSSVEGGEDFRESGNLGLLDQKCALEWVQKNIAAFGGDPGNVTIFGESAGAGSVSLLPLMEGTDGLFRRMIAESGSVALTYSRDECRNLTEMLTEETGCTNMDELMALSEEELKEVNEKLNDYNNFPERDGIVLPEDLYGAYESGGGGGIDLLIGTNADEARYWIREMAYTVPALPGLLTYRLLLPVMYENNLKELTAEEKESVKEFMSMQTGGRTWKQTEFYNETLFRVPAMKLAECHSDNGNNTFVYYWTYPCADKTLGACHAVELAYVFNNLQEAIYTGGNIDTELADSVQEMWVNFARTGDPSTTRHTWEQYDSSERKTMVLGSEIHMENDIKADQRKEIEPLLHHYFNGCYSQLSYNVPQTYRIILQLAAAAAIIIAAVRILARFRDRRKNKTEE